MISFGENEVGKELRSGKVMNDAIGESRRRRWSVSITTHKAAPRVCRRMAKSHHSAMEIVSGGFVCKESKSRQKAREAKDFRWPL
jgi:hypothetical protein